MTFKARFGWYQPKPNSNLVKVWISDSAFIAGQTWYCIHYADTTKDWVKASKVTEFSNVKSV